MSEAPKTRPKMPIPVVRPSGTFKKPLPPGIDPNEALRMSQTDVFHPKQRGQSHGEGGAPTNPPQGGTLIQVPAEPVIQSLPDNLVDPEKISTAQVPATFGFDAAMLLPQLTSGKIMIPLELITAQIAGDVTRVGANKKEPVRIPLPDVVACIPPEMLTIEGQVVQEIDPNFVESPFSEGKQGKAPEVKIVEPARAAPSIPQPPPEVPAPAPLPPSVASEQPDSVRIESPVPVEVPPGETVTSVRLFLASLLKRLPADLLVVPLEQCLEQAGEHIVDLPLDLVLPKLGSGRIALEYGVLHPYFPPEMVLSLNSVNKATEITLPLDRIVAQIPAEMMKVVGVKKVELPDDGTIPANLFTEKAAGASMPAPAAAAPAPEAEAAAQPQAEPAPVVPGRPAEPKDLEVCPTAENIDEAVLLSRINAFQLADFTELNGISAQAARKILEQRERSKTLSLQDLSELGIRRKTLLRLTGMPDPAGAVEASVLNRLLTLTDQRTLKVQEIIDTAIAKYGVLAGMMVAEDGLVLAGKPPDGFDKQMISAFIPQIFRHLARGIEPAGAGKASRVTILLEQHLVSLFRAPGIFLIFWHSREKMNREFFKRAERLTEELSRQNLSAASSG
jgi:hypothetical protein